MTESVEQVAAGGSYTKLRLACGGLVMAAMIFALYEHRAHVSAALPYLLLLACPLMHLFHGHGHRHRPGTADRK